MTEIAELFDRDPFTLTREDVGAIVAYLRDSRKQFNLGNRTAGKAPKKKLEAGEAKDLLDKLL